MAMGEVDQDDHPYHTTALVTTTLLTRPHEDISRTSRTWWREITFILTT
jgi:hypothetical protein